MTRSLPPKEDEFEVSVIGPGRGECVVLHLGHNQWCIVDSCVGPGSKRPAAIEYLSSLGCNALEGVLLVLATHWHDDHIHGIARSLEQLPNAQFSCSMALNTGQFAKLVALTSETIQDGSGVDEFAAIFDLILERKAKKQPTKLVAPLFAIENRTLLTLPNGARRFPARVIALSPSDGTVKIALEQISQLIPKSGGEQRRIQNRAPNKTSVVLWIEVGSRRALLGADLEETGYHGEGWSGVLSSFHPSERAAIFKVPHHGSPNADSPGVWRDLLRPDPIAIVTPFTPGKGLPQSSDLERLQVRTSSLYCSSVPKSKPPKRDPSVEKLVRHIPRRPLEGALGHVRTRWSVTDTDSLPDIEMFNGAYHVTR